MDPRREREGGRCGQRGVNPVKIRAAHRRNRGLTLIDCLVYMSLFGLVTALATTCAFKLERQARVLHRRSEELTRALKAGELWRADIRSATNEPAIVAYRGQSLLKIPTIDGEVLYYFESSALWRKPAKSAQFGLFLPDLKLCSMLPERRKNARGWICELELASKIQQQKMRPLFTFRAVAPQPEP